MIILWIPSHSELLETLVVSQINKAGIHHRIHRSLTSVPKLRTGDVCLCMGKQVFTKLQSLDLIKKNVGMGIMRDTPILVNKKKSVLLVSYHPNAVLTEYNRKSEIVWDAKLACRIHNTKTSKPVLGNYQYVKSFNETLKAIHQRYLEAGKKVPVALDLETMGLYPYYDDKHIVSVQVTYEGGQGDAFRFKSGSYPVLIVNQIKKLCSLDYVIMVGANLKFDLEWMKDKWELVCTNFKFDTLLVGSLLNENRLNSLEYHAKEYLPLGGYDTPMLKKYDKGHMELIPDNDLLDYSAGDTDACIQVAKIFKKELLKDKKLANFYVNLLHPSSMAFAQMEHRGCLVDVEVYRKLKKRVAAYLDETSKKAFALMPYAIIKKYTEDKKGLKLTRGCILSDYMFTKLGLNLKPKMFTEKEKKPSTALEHFEMFADNKKAVKFISIMRDFNSAKKTMSTYINGFMKHVRPDGKFHPTYLLHVGAYDGKESGANTGRSSCKDPAWQTIPKHTVWAKPLREAYTCPEGYVMLQADFSQGELKIAACLANEMNMIEAFLAGEDLHIKTAARLNNYTVENFKALDKEIKYELRSGAKAANFGLLYLMGWKGFIEYARKSYGVILTEDQAKEHRNTFLYDLYPRLPDWHEECIATAMRDGYVRSPLGRIRHLPLINSNINSVRAQQERRSVNAPTQATLSDLTQFSMSILHKKYPELWMFGMCHDALYFYVPTHERDMWASRIKHVMENLPLKKVFNWNHQVPFTVDIEASSTNMAELSEIEVE